LANDDVKTPTSLVGRKISPIFVSHSVCELMRSILFLSFISLNLCVPFSFLLKALP
jgi:glutaredoxin 2